MTDYYPVQARRRASGELELLGLGAPMIREELTRLERRVAELAAEKAALEARVVKVFADDLEQLEEEGERHEVIEHIEEMRDLILTTPSRIVAVDEITPDSPTDLFNRAEPSCELCHGFGYKLRAVDERLERRVCACVRPAEELGLR